MSGGFFRGTSADQDTRFSNKQAKLLKSQKFSPELEHLVDMSKVNMEVMKPWIAKRVTELLGFEDEVLINFIHGLLDKKEANGKEVQIQITGFMEKNTGKFMKELWTLLLSAQKNASGIPQQFLDAKEEELQKKKAENDRITSEIQKKKDIEGREIMEEKERLKKLAAGLDMKINDTASDPTVKPRDSGQYIHDGKESDKRNGVRARNRVSRSPHSPAVSTSPHRVSPSSGRHRSRSISRSPEARARSVSSERIRRSPRRHSISPRRRSPWRSHRGAYLLQRSRSRSNYRSPSPIRHRMHSPYYHDSPFRRRRTPSPTKRRRSPSPARRHRSPSPARRHRSPSPARRRRSPSPARRRRSPSPVRRRRSPSPARLRRSPSPARRRRSPSPARRHRSPPPMRRRRSPSPVQRRSPVMRGRSPSPVRRPPIRVWRRSDSPMQSPSPIRRRYGSRSPRRRSPSPLRRRSPVSGKKRSPSLSPRRSLSPDEWSSQSPTRRVSPSPVRRNSPIRQRNSPVRVQEKLSPEIHQHSRPLQSGQRDKDSKASHLNSEDSMSTPEKFPIRPVSPQAMSRTSSEDRSPRKSPRQRRERLTDERGSSPPKKPRSQRPSHDSPEKSKGAEETYYYRESRHLKTTSPQRKSKYSSPVSKQNDSPAKFHDEDEFSPERATGHLTPKYHHYDNIDHRKKIREIKRDRTPGEGGESPSQQKSPMNTQILSSKKPRETYAADIKKPDDKNLSHSNYAKNSDRGHKSEATQDLVRKVDRANHNASYDSVSEESDKNRKDRRKQKRSEKKFVSSDEDYSSDSELEDRKEAKRKKREGKKQRKEEKRQRREERRHRREERRAEKLRVKSRPAYISEDEEAERLDRSDNEETLSEQKKLEIELRNKALESLKAKRGMDN
ncbi:PREDICTED: serine/arginine repetitive matrix protein 1-like isoform X3 [Lupinus angustifolius]|uniref:serine/arginine repetitive matrix protein 1-like isoform X3 n=1 Tax=Lupinus angustifolius TaxID=3871 RepID=UPI00092E7622|nr:PREDICTED: serine/arginine repetitive matrix protein 1-like isoform X3 [Lupinus angustifolius]